MTQIRINQTSGRSLRAGPVLLAALGVLIPAANLTAQLNDPQTFEGATLNQPFAVPPNSVANWGLDGTCSPGMVFDDDNKGDNGSRCLRTRIPVGVGTRLIRDLNPGPGSSTIGGMARAQIDVSHRLFFSADDGTGTTGQELYHFLNALYPLVVLTSDINPGSGSSSPQNLFQHIGTRFYFSADDGTTGRELYSMTLNGKLVNNVVRVKDINPSPGASSNPSAFASGPDPTGTPPPLILFSADDGITGRELWKSDSSDTNTSIVADINPTAGVGSDPQLLVSLSPTPDTTKVFFTADDGVNGRELWRSDATGGGTGMCKDIVAGPTGSNPTNLTAVTLVVQGNLTPTLFFTVDSDGVNGQELWKSLGALDGSDTVQVSDLGATGATVGNLKAVGTMLMFTVGNSLWKSGGTGATTALVQNFTSLPGPLVTLGSSVYFAADDGTGHGVELWKSDGTTTVEVKDIHPGAGSSSPANLAAFNGVVYFSADDGPGATENHGRELWRTDATLGAVMVMDINPGPASSNPANINALETLPELSQGITGLPSYGSVAFTADDGTHGTEPWQTDGVVGGAPDHAGLSYKWDLVPVIAAHQAGMSAVAGIDSNVLSVRWMHDWSGQGTDNTSPLATAHQSNFYLELTDGVDRAPLDITHVDCGDGNLPRPKAALTDGNSHNAIAFGMVSVLDQDPCGTEPRLPGSPGIPTADVPAIYDGHDWIPLDLSHLPAAVPTEPTPTGPALAKAAFPGSNISVFPFDSTMPTLPAGISLAAADDNPWATRRFLTVRVDIFTDFVRMVWYSRQTERLYVATVERKYKGGFKAFYMGNPDCVQQPYLFYTDTINLNGGLLTDTVDPSGACCSPSGCTDVTDASQCPGGTFSPWRSCTGPGAILCCPKPWADWDRDGDVDHNDFGGFQACFAPTGPVSGLCKCFDKAAPIGVLNGNLDAQADDFDEFLSCVSGPAVPFNFASPPAGCNTACPSGVTCPP